MAAGSRQQVTPLKLVMAIVGGIIGAVVGWVIAILVNSTYATSPTMIGWNRYIIWDSEDPGPSVGLEDIMVVAIWLACMVGGVVFGVRIALSSGRGRRRKEG